VLLVGQLLSFSLKWMMIIGPTAEILGPSSTTLTGSAAKVIEFGENVEITENKGYYAVQGHSRSLMSIPIESPYATSY